MYGLDWIASGCGVLACYLVGRNKHYGWLLYATASAINAYLGYHAGLLGLMGGSLCYLVLELKGFYQNHRGKV